jgi:hypothetical protein
MEYIIVKHSDSTKVTERVLSLIKRGFKPHGGISVGIGLSAVNKQVIYVQAMIKE